MRLIIWGRKVFFRKETIDKELVVLRSFHADFKVDEIGRIRSEFGKE